MTSTAITRIAISVGLMRASSLQNPTLMPNAQGLLLILASPETAAFLTAPRSL